MASQPAEGLIVEMEAAMQRVSLHQPSLEPMPEGVGRRRRTETSLTSLPDDDLIHVLRYLETRELLQCRSVCRRLRDLALLPHLWRHRCLTLKSDCVQLVAATLRLAPCLGTLELVLRQKQSKTNSQLTSLLVSTNCAIRKLRFVLGKTSAVFAVMVLARQATLGRLRTVRLMSCSWRDVPNLRLLLEELLYTRGLTTVECYENFVESDADVSPGPCIPKAAKRDAIPASLRRLVYGLQDDILPSYLQWHADTLQEVLLGDEVKPPAGTAALLGALRRLRQLRCPLLDGMPALLQCPALDTLVLRVDLNPSTRPFLPGVLEYLRQAVAGRLKTLDLAFTVPTGADEANLVLCLAGRGAASALRSLSLSYGEEAWEPQPELLPLASVLHRLVNLVSLDIDGPPSTAFLDAMDGKVLPRLQCLSVFIGHESGESWGRGCPHEWAHGDEPRALLRKYPRLHLVVYTLHLPGCSACLYRGCDVCKCGFCDAHRCHKFASNDSHVLFSHPDHELCNKDLSGYADVDFRVDLSP